MQSNIQKISMYINEFKHIIGFEVVTSDRYNLYYLKSFIDSKFVDRQEKGKKQFSEIEQYLQKMLQSEVATTYYSLENVKLLELQNFYVSNVMFNRYWLNYNQSTYDYRYIEKHKEVILYQNLEFIF